MTTYDLLCVDCAEALTVGKMVCFDESMQPVPWSVTGWRDAQTGEWTRGERLWRVVERFLILHRGHELRVLTELAIDKLDPEAARIASVESPDALFGRAVDPEPHPEEDLAAIGDETLERMRRKIGTRA